ncbi:hypothetical protein BH09SUM1_BH09SUM1_28500 [soil metagenome]
MEVLRIVPSEQLSICLIALLAMSVVLPVLAGKIESAKQDAKRATWLGQLIMAVCGVAMIAAPAYSVISLVFAAMVCAAFAVKLQQLRRAAAKLPRR